jgi:hypothetical protein
VSTKANQGHAELWNAIEALPIRREQASAADALFQQAIERLSQRFEGCKTNADVINLANAWQRGEVATADAIQTLLNLASRAP